MLKRAFSIFLIVLLLNTILPISIFADDQSNSGIVPTQVLNELPTSWKYTLFSGSETHPINIQSSSTYISGNVFSNHNFVHRGSNLQVEGEILAAGTIDSQRGMLEAWDQWEDLNPIPMPDFGRVIRSIVELDTDVYHQSKQFNGNQLKVERSMIVNGNITFNGSKFAGKDYIVASGDITFNVSSLESMEDEPLILYSENGDITIRSSNNTIRGILYAPNGTVQINASSFELEGRIIADRIVLSGSKFEIVDNYDDLSLINGQYQVLACYDRYSNLYKDVPFNDYNTPYNNPTVMEIQDLLLESTKAMSDDIVHSMELCYVVLDKVKELKAELEQEKQILEQIAADPFGDYDGDGLLNGYELEMLRDYTNPMEYDSDGDGIPDGDEDPDRDGLSNLKEQELGTDPTVPDTDGDGLKDGSEVRLGTDPLSADTDGDGIIDSEEIYTQTIQGPVPNVKLEITAIGDISEAVYIFDATSNIVADHGYSVTDSVYSVSGLYEFRSELPFEHAKIHLPVDLDKLGDREIEHVKIVYFDEELMTFIPLENQGVDPETGTVWGETDHFSLYTLFYLPNLGAIWQVPFISGDRESDSEIIFLDVMFVIDSSGSMDWNDPNDYRKTAAKNFVDGLIPGSRVGVVTGDRAGVVDFDSYASLRQSLTDNFDQVKAAIDRIDASGGTDIGAGVNLANNELIRNSSDDRIKIQILLTDGDGSYSHRYTDTAVQNGIVIYTIGLGSDVNENLLKEISGRTGGQYFHASSAEDLPIVFDRIRDIVNEQEDTDGDGIPDIVEMQGIRVGLFFDRVIYTDPYNPDTDGDGLLDGEEIGEAIEINVFGFKHRFYPMYSNPTLYDSDKDGISDYEERKVYGTNPLSSDSDYDGLEDGFEVSYVPPHIQQGGILALQSNSSKQYLNPMRFDTDGDGISDGIEYQDPNLDPLIPDMIINDRNGYRIKSVENLSGRVHVYSPIIVEKSGTLNIQSGTEIISYIDRLRDDTIRVYGRLNSGLDYLSNDNVVFKSGMESSRSLWRGIVAIEGAELNLRDTYVVKAQNALWLNGGVKVKLDNGAFDYNDFAIYVALHSIEMHHYDLGTVDLNVSNSGFYDDIYIRNQTYATIRDSGIYNASLIVESYEADVLLERVKMENRNGTALEIEHVNGQPEVYVIDSEIKNNKIGILTSGRGARVYVDGSSIINNDIGIKAKDDGYTYISDTVKFAGNAQDYVIQKAGWAFPIYLAQGIALEIGEDVLYLIPDLLSFAEALVTGKINMAVLRQALGDMWDEYKDTFNNIIYSFNKVVSGNATKSETIQYGRDLALVIEVITVAKAAVKIGHGGLKKLVNNIDDVKKAIASCSCFPAGTTVLTDNGEKNIEDIQIGDRVLSKNVETGEIAYKEVTHVFKNERDVIYELTIGDEVLKTTDTHPFWVDGKGWVLAADLQVGDKLQLSNGSSISIDSIIINRYNEPVNVYNFTVADFHTYYVSNLEIWVHNRRSGWCEIADSVNKMIGEYVAEIKRMYPDAKIGYRGSLATGTKFSTGGDFDPNDFDVDAFIVSDELASKFDPTEIFRSASDIDELRHICEELERTFIKTFNGYRTKPGKEFTFRVWTEAEFKNKVERFGYVFID